MESKNTLGVNPLNKEKKAIFPSVKKIEQSSWIRSTGLALSILCGIHCLALPFLFLYTSVNDGNSFLTNPLVEWAIMGLAVGFATNTIYKDYQHHQKKIPLLFLFLSYCILFPAFLWHHHTWIAAGAVCLVIAQGINWNGHHRHCKH